MSALASAVVAPEAALPGRSESMPTPERHAVLGTPIAPPFPEGVSEAIFGMGCFWGAEKVFWQLGGVYTTAVGYTGGYTPNPTYQEVCSEYTGHTEAVRVIFDPEAIDYEALARAFWEHHDPTQWMRQGPDVGSRYRSVIYTLGEGQAEAAERSRRRYQEELERAGYGAITTEILPAATFYYAEPYHQQYLAKNPSGYCGLGGTGVSCPA